VCDKLNRTKLESEIFSSMFCVCLVHNADDCMKSVYLLLHVAIETVKLSFSSYVYD